MIWNCRQLDPLDVSRICFARQRYVINWAGKKIKYKQRFNHDKNYENSGPKILRANLGDLWANPMWVHSWSNRKINPKSTKTDQHWFGIWNIFYGPTFVRWITKLDFHMFQLCFETTKQIVWIWYKSTSRSFDYIYIYSCWCVMSLWTKELNFSADQMTMMISAAVPWHLPSEMAMDVELKACFCMGLNMVEAFSWGWTIHVFLVYFFLAPDSATEEKQGLRLDDWTPSIHV